MYHQNDDFAWKMWEKLNPSQYIGNDNLYVIMFLQVGKIFVIGLVIEQFRVWIFKLFGLLGKTKFFNNIKLKFENMFFKIQEKV